MDINKDVFPFSRAEKDDNQNDDISMMEEVYAGPEFFERSYNDTQMMAVYAGPEYFNSSEPIPPVKPDDGQFNFVYPGLEFFNKKDGEE